MFLIVSAEEWAVSSHLFDLKDIFKPPGQRRSVADRIRVGGVPVRPEISV